MPDISFASFNPRSFEQFAQALTAGVLGDGIMVFGDGPDGGREATFTGKVSYPSSKENWNGRILMQAKFKQHLDRDHRDADWLVSELSGEAESLKANGNAPDYYILATNVRLSGVEGKVRKGGQQKVDEAFERHLKPLGVKKLHVWHEEKIATLLDRDPELFRSYGAWLAPREVLAAVFQSISDQVPDFGATMLRLLQREIRDERATRLQQAGHVDDAPTPLESVFVDLPYSAPEGDTERRVALLERCRSPESGVVGSGILQDLLLYTSLKLDSSTTAQKSLGGQLPPTGRHLLLGGPGQGKSTISQFLAQVARTRILSDQPSGMISPEAKPVIEAVQRRMVELGLPLDGPRRYPVRIDLPTFADTLAKGSAGENRLSLLQFITDRISRTAAAPKLDLATMRRWLGAYPWLLILDGLDEVPPSANRRDVLDAIADFSDEAVPINADVAIVVTTRPQGYNDDLNPELYLRHEMSRLDPTKAVAYATQVATLKISDAGRRARVLERVEAAAKNPTTALLMISPLQVAILLHLVDQRGTAPTDRWTLFNEYLAIVIKREQEKQGEAGRVVRERSFLIENILRRSGFLLHVDAELRGGAEAFLTIKRFQQLVRDLLEEEGHEGSELEAALKEIIVTITDRLVFLEQRIEGRIEFDVRSLQEFMAAAQLMEGSDDSVTERLHAVVGRSHWQHVFRIAASKAFSVPDAKKYRDAIITANSFASTSSEGARCLSRGGVMSLDLILDGVAHDQPRYRKLLLDQAFGVLKTGQFTHVAQLTEALAAASPEEATYHLQPQLSSQEGRQSLPAWSILSRLLEMPDDWADQLFSSSWPIAGEYRLEVASVVHAPPEGSKSAFLVKSAIVASGPKAACEAVLRSRYRDYHQYHVKDAERASILKLSGSFGQKIVTEVGVNGGKDATLRLKLMTIEGSRQRGLLELPKGPKWQLLQPLQKFVAAPNVKHLAAYARSLANNELLEAVPWTSIPWMASTIATNVEFGADPISIANTVLAGGFGSPEDWSRAEERLRVNGLTERDLEFWKSGSFFGPDVAEVGAPFSPYILLTHEPADDWPITQKLLMQTMQESKLGAVREQLRRMVEFSMSEAWSRNLSAQEYIDLSILGNRMGRFIPPMTLSAVDERFLTDATLLVVLAQAGKAERFSTTNRASKISPVVFNKMVEAADDPSLFHVACGLYSLEPFLLRELAGLSSAKIKHALSDAPYSDAVAVMGYLCECLSASQVVHYCTRGGVETLEQHALYAVANDSSTPKEDAEMILATLSEAVVKGNMNMRRDVASQLEKILSSVPSDLRTRSTWLDLKLPKVLFEMVQQAA